MDGDFNGGLVWGQGRIVGGGGGVGGLLGIVYPGVLGVGRLGTRVTATAGSPGRCPGRRGSVGVMHHPVPWGWGCSCLPVGDRHWNWRAGSFLANRGKKGLKIKITGTSILVMRKLAWVWKVSSTSSFKLFISIYTLKNSQRTRQYFSMSIAKSRESEIHVPWPGMPWIILKGNKKDFNRGHGHWDGYRV